MRTCVGCRQVKPKAELVRIVRTPAGAVEADPTGKKSGRGAYLCHFRQCWENGLRKGSLEHTLKVRLQPEARLSLLDIARAFPAPEPVSTLIP